MDLKTIKGYKGLSSQKTMLSDKGRNTIPVSKNFNKYLIIMKRKVKEARARLRKWKKEGATIPKKAPERFHNAKKVQSDK